MFARSITGEVGVGDLLKTNFIYDESRPFEVRLQNVKGTDIVFDRDLLAEAFSTPGKVSGIGSIRFLVNGDGLVMSLVMTSYVYTVIYPADEAQDFLNEVFAAVSWGSESVDLDSLIDDFFNDKI